jgi:death-on-curing protein
MGAADGVRYLSAAELQAIQDRLLERFGGQAGVRDAGLLESALFRPRTGHYSDLAAMAAALYESLLGGRPFASGNERLAFFAVDVFLRLNGWQLRLSAPEAERYLHGLLDRREADFAHLEPWLRRALVPLLR